MSSVVFEKSRVDEAINLLTGIGRDLSSLTDEFRDASNQIINARGFQEYVGGFSYNNVEEWIGKANDITNETIANLAYKESQVLELEGDVAGAQSVLMSLPSAVKDIMGSSGEVSAEASSNVLVRTGATVGTFCVSLFEGLGQVVEAGWDLGDMAITGVRSLFKMGSNLLSGKSVMDGIESMWNETSARVSEKKCESIFNKFYSDTTIGRGLKTNAYGFDTVRSVGNGIGYATGVVALSALTFGTGAAGLGATAGILGVSRGSEKAWGDGASAGRGLVYGLASGAWEGAQWALGAKINQLSTGGQIAKGLFKGAQGGVGKRILLDSAVATVEGFVQPAMSMIYKDYEGDTLFDSYTKAFEENGGWKSVITQAVIGGTMSAASEIFSGRMALKKQKGDASIVESESTGVSVDDAAGVDGESSRVFVDDTSVVYREYSNEEFPVQTRQRVDEWRSRLDKQELEVIENYIGEYEGCSYRTMNGLARKTLIDYDKKQIVLKGPGGERRIPMDDWMTKHNETITTFLQRTRDDINTLNGAIRKSDLITEPTIVHRAASNSLDLFKSFGLTGEPTLDKLKTLIGKEYFEEGFMSCSPGKVPFRKKVNFELYLDPGTHAASLFPWNANENEILLELKQRFLIKDVIQNGDSFTIKMKTIPFKK